MKLNSIKGGKFATVLLAICGIASVVVCLFIEEDSKWLAAVILAVIYAAALLLMIRTGSLNVVELDETGVKSDRAEYTWDNVYITVENYDFGDGNPTCRAYFSDRVLATKDDVKQAKQLGMYVDLHPNRLKYVLPYYNKPLDIRALIYSKKLSNALYAHNEKFVAKLTFVCGNCEIPFLAVKNALDNTLCIYCDECDVLYRNLDDLQSGTEMDWDDGFEWGGVATPQEVTSFGWGKYLKP